MGPGDAVAIIKGAEAEVDCMGTAAPGPALQRPAAKRNLLNFAQPDSREPALSEVEGAAVPT